MQLLSTYSVATDPDGLAPNPDGPAQYPVGLALFKVADTSQPPLNISYC
jgi:hypothetical protein